MALDAGFAGILGALIGASATLAGNWLTYHLQNRRSSFLAEKRRGLLRRELQNRKYTWRSIERLCAVVGADGSTTSELLLEIGARTSLTDKKIWALESKAPYPDEDALKGL
jgi:hypothetical protein